MDQYEYIEEIDDDIEDIIEVDEADDIEDIIEVEDDIEYIEEVYKFNPNHGKDGRFATGNGNGLTGGGGSGNLQSSSNEVSATGANKFAKGFSKKNLAEHWDGGHAHKDMYPGITKEAYGERALKLIQKPVSENILGYKNKNGQIVRYDEKTNDFVKGKPSLGIATMFKPKNGKLYYEQWKEKEAVGDE